MATMASQLSAAQRRLPHILARSTRRSLHLRPAISSSSSSSRALSHRVATTRAQHMPSTSCTVSGSNINNNNPSLRFMSTNAPKTDEDDGSNDGEVSDGGDGGDGGGGDEPPKLNPSVLSNIYNHQRAHYNRAVSRLRKQYYAEQQSQREREQRRKSLEEARLKRATLERRRLKAMRTAENAQKQIDKAERRRIEWEKELAQTQRERDAKKELYRRARQRIVNELEAECHLWLTTPAEVEKALGNPHASQLLWARPGGMIGAPSGPDTGFGDFGEFWRYECHTWDTRPTYKDPKEVMLEEIEYMAYLQTNNDARYWDKAKVTEHERMEQRARLRAIVREEGRRSLLNKQREMMRDIYGSGNKQEEQKGGRLPPTAMPAPKLDYLADYEAQEREGVEIMMRNPRRFFLFESDLPDPTSKTGAMGDPRDDMNIGEDGETLGTADSTSLGASLGRPIGLRNPFFNDKPTAFPVRMGRDLPPDTRTEKEKKRDERQERMRQAAEEAALAAKTGAAYEVAMAAEEDLEDGSEDVDYEKAEEDAEKELWADQEEAWNATDRKVFEMTPPLARLTPDDIDWIIEQLAAKTKKAQDRLDFEEKVRRKELEKSMSGDSVQRPIESMDDIDKYVMEGLGYDMDKMTALVQELTPEQSMVLEDIDFTGRVGITAEEMTRELSVVPGLSDEQIQLLVEMEMSLLNDPKLKLLTKMG